MRKIILFLCVCCLVGVAYAQEPFRVMFYNVENLFDCQHDTLKNDYEFLPDAPKGWTRARYNDKLAKIWKLAHIRMDFKGIMQSAWTRKG